MFQVTQRAWEALNVPRETGRRALLHRQGKVLAATHQYEAVVRQKKNQCFGEKMRKYTFDSSNKKHMCVFLQDRGNCYLDSLSQAAIKVLKISEKLWQRKQPSEVWRRDEQVFDLRTELESLCTTRGRRFSTSKQYRDMFCIISYCSIGRGTRNGANSTKRGTTLTRSMASK